MWAAILVSLAAQCSGPACPNPCTACTFLPDEGTNPSLAGWRAVMTDVSRRQNLEGLPAIASIEVGADRGTRAAAEFPCKLLPAIGMTESGLAQFCDNGLTIISFDCGFGVMQVTSGAARYPGLQSRVDVNVAAGADILAQKWNGDQSFGGHFGDSDPQLLESWYFATWAYNGFVYSNNPSNPDKPAERPPFNSPATLSRRSYPYQEIVWGYLGFPLSKEGEPVFSSLLPTYPPTCSGGLADRACCDANANCVGVPNQSGLFDVATPCRSRPTPIPASRSARRRGVRRPTSARSSLTTPTPASPSRATSQQSPATPRAASPAASARSPPSPAAAPSWPAGGAPRRRRAPSPCRASCR